MARKMEYTQAKELAGNIEGLAVEIDDLIKKIVAEIEENFNDENFFAGGYAESVLTAWNNTSSSFDTFVNYLKTTQEKLEQSALAMQDFAQQQ